MLISIIYPVRSLKQDETVTRAVKEYSHLEDLEHIIVSSAREDKNAIFVETHSRARRMNIGAKHASGELLLFHHPRSLIDIEGIKHLLTFKGDWGAFTHAFDESGFFYDFTSFYSNSFRGDIRSIFYLDHCIFVRKKLFEKVGGFDEVDIFEDTLISRELKKISKAQRLKYISRTSAIRFKRNGFWKQALLNLKMKVNFLLNLNLNKMNEDYESGLNLNSDYSKD